MLSPAVEDYLKTIYLVGESDTVAMSVLADRMGVAAASVTNMAKRLDRLGLVNYQAYQGVALTAAGLKIALEIVRHHRLLETYLSEIMGYDWSAVHAEAEKLEHHISEEFEQRIDEMLGFPTHDPHGHPIPTVDGRIANIPAEPLSGCPTGATVVVKRVSDDDPLVLNRLQQLGLLPGVTVHISHTDKDEMTLLVGSDTSRVDGSLLSHVFVGQAETQL